ncbi:MAG TPA: dUTP diphosphatase [Flavobacteriales bacterium]|nr:dUTP diphosphatase [Flavobacteriales bacterium]HIO73488.1 dUTP diphosphatase [Flavobacteriales bacterium]
MKVKIVNRSKYHLPSYSTDGSAGMDLRANIENDIALNPMERSLIPTGLYLEIPTGYEAQVRPRSGLAIKSGITVLNSPGTIDADYRGEVKVILVNFSDVPFVISDGDRIAQLVFSSHETVSWLEEVILKGTRRGDGGFGSSGNN